MIRVYDGATIRGGYVLQATSCEVTEEAGGAYECTLTMPTRPDDERWKALQPGNILDVPVPPTHMEGFDLGEVSYWRVKTSIPIGLYIDISGSLDTLYDEVVMGEQLATGTRRTWMGGYYHTGIAGETIPLVDNHNIGDVFRFACNYAADGHTLWYTPAGSGGNPIDPSYRTNSITGTLAAKLQPGDLLTKIFDFSNLLIYAQTMDGKTGYVVRNHLEYVEPAARPVIVFLQQPEDVTTKNSTYATFGVAVSSHSAVTFQWQTLTTAEGASWVDTSLSGNKTNRLRFKMTSGYNGRQYRCVVTDEEGNTAISDAATLTRSTTEEQGDLDILDSVVIPFDVPERDITRQRFRIDSVTVNTSSGTVEAHAQHISYDGAGSPAGQCALQMVTPASAAELLRASLLEPTSIGIAVGCSSTIREADWTYRNLANALLDPDTGLVALARGRLIRDNLEIFIPANEQTSPKLRLARGVNLRGVTWKQDSAEIINRVIPVAKDENGDELLLPEGYIDSADTGFPIRRAEVLETGLQVGQSQKQADGSVIILTRAMVLEQMRQLAQARFDTDHADAARVSLSVDFLLLGDTEEFRQYRGLQSVQLYDWILIEDSAVGLSTVAQVKSIRWDAILGRYNGVTLGDVRDHGLRAVAGYELGTRIISTRMLTPELRERLGV